MLRFFTVLIAFLVSIHTVPAFAKQHITLTKENTVVLRGEVTSQSVDKALNAILQNSSPNIYLYISSPGGSIMAGVHFIDKLRSSGKNVTCIADIAASMAFVILQSCDTRYVLDSSLIMQHVASYGLEGEAPKNWKLVQMIHRMLDVLDKSQADRLKLSLNEFRSKTRDDWWLLGGDAVTARAADETVEVSCNSELLRSRVKEEIPVFIFKVDVTWYGCPLHRAPEKVEMGKGLTETNVTLLTADERNAIKNDLEKLRRATNFGELLSQCSEGFSNCKWIKEMNSLTVGN